ncbi:hypothetical protein GCM10010298_73160 [Streptomyces microflavus]|uniref:Uncharacterized protein n=1 Tax=Streptomyces microflavus TaxID=1919 RepID=A0A7J0CIM0_STRMI|nr:hypothetical protein Smic_08890 [Streptomyces microflavus]GGX97120.1 hypothetical protein GCM10010298_73160 [Streptomyces microflavus]
MALPREWEGGEGPSECLHGGQYEVVAACDVGTFVCEDGCELERRERVEHPLRDHDAGVAAGQAVSGRRIMLQDNGLVPRRVAPYEIYCGGVPPPPSTAPQQGSAVPEADPESHSDRRYPAGDSERGFSCSRSVRWCPQRQAAGVQEADQADVHATIRWDSLRRSQDHGGDEGERKSQPDCERGPG